MDAGIQRQLNDRLYDKRKIGALELEGVVREANAAGDHDKVRKIVSQLCHEYAYAIHQPHARNGGLIGLAAAAIALGPDVAPYLDEIIPPVLACFTDQDARVRYYACESMYNIAKVAKGEILVYFNHVFDALCKLAADSDLSVKNGAELLDRLVKDIVSESAATYVSVVPPSKGEEDKEPAAESFTPAFSLSRFMPLLKERIHVINPFTRMFLVSWLTLLDSIPDLELVTHLPAFLEGLFKFLADPNRDVYVAAQEAIDRFLNEIRRIARLRQGLVDGKGRRQQRKKNESDQEAVSDSDSARDSDSEVTDEEEDGDDAADGNWIPGQDVQINYSDILEILLDFTKTPTEQEIQLTVMRWIDSFFEICPEDVAPAMPQLLTQVLPILSSNADKVRQAANGVNSTMMEFIESIPIESQQDNQTIIARPPLSRVSEQRRDSSASRRGQSISKEEEMASMKRQSSQQTEPAPTKPLWELDFSACVEALTLQLLNEHEATRVASLTWLTMMHRKARPKITAIHDGTFPALLKTLSDPSEAVVTKDLQLLSQISKNSEDDYFSMFMINLLQLFSTDRRLLETRGNLIIRQLCITLSSERIYRILADCLEKEEDLEFASIMVQNLNNNLITAPELTDLRKRLRNLESKDGQAIFVALFRSWCHNAVATFSLCLLAQAYEQAYNLLQIFAELEMTVNMLIQIDKLVQLLESPVFTYLRLQLLEPEKYPFLYKCLYGLLMLLPQSSAFAALKNRLNSVSAIGYLHIVPRGAQTPTGSYERGSRLKGRDEMSVRWMELLDKFKATQEKSAGLGVVYPHDIGSSAGGSGLGEGGVMRLPSRASTVLTGAGGLPGILGTTDLSNTAAGIAASRGNLASVPPGVLAGAAANANAGAAGGGSQPAKARSGLSHFRFGGSSSSSSKKKK